MIKPLPICFTVNFVPETYDFIKLYHDLWRFTPGLNDPGLFSTISQFKINIITFIAKTFTTIVNKNLDFYSSKD